MTAKFMLSKRPVLRITVALFFLLKTGLVLYLFYFEVLMRQHWKLGDRGDVTRRNCFCGIGKIFEVDNAKKLLLVQNLFHIRGVQEKYFQ